MRRVGFRLCMRLAEWARALDAPDLQAKCVALGMVILFGRPK